MTETELDSLGFRVLEDEEDDDFGLVWHWGCYTYERPDGTRTYLPILYYNTKTKKVWCSSLEFERNVEHYSTMLNVIDSVSFLMNTQV